MTELLAAGTAYDCVICNNDAMALGVIDALRAAGKDPSEVPIAGVDCTEEGAEALRAGDLYVTVKQDAAVQAETAVAAAMNLSSGQPFDAGLDFSLKIDGQATPYSIYIPASATIAD